MGEYLLRNMVRETNQEISVSSAGIGALVDHGADELAIEVMLENGIDISAHRARQLDEAIAKSNELILVMERWQQKEIERLYPFSCGRVHLIGKWGNVEIDDPYQMSKTQFVEAFEKINESCIQWNKKLC